MTHLRHSAESHLMTEPQKVGAVAWSYEHHGNRPGPNINGVGWRHKRHIRSAPAEPASTPEVTRSRGIKMNSHSATG